MMIPASPLGRQVVQQATGQKVALMIAPLVKDLLPPPEKRRMLLMRSLSQAAGQAAVMTWLLKLQPCPIKLDAVSLLMTAATDDGHHVLAVRPA